ncbi:hypothetical protein Tco_0847502 [Tanacetum coccineum]
MKFWQERRRYQANPKDSHLVAVKRIFRYLKGTLNLGLYYLKGSGFDLKSYSDSDYAGCNLDRKSTSGGCQILGEKLVCWSAKKQSSVVMSSAEAEYVAAVECCAQVLWIKSQLANYDVLYDNVPIFCDNTSVIAISNNIVLHFRTKHIDIRYHFIRDHILKGDIELHVVHTDLQLVEIFTKPLAEPSFTRLVAELGIIAFNNGIALLEHPNTLYLPMISSLSNCCVSTALTKQPSAYYYEYLRKFWHSAEVDATNTITFTLSNFDKPLSFNLDDFSSIIGLKYSENYISVPPKETVRAGLATLGLVDENDTTISSTDLVNSSPLRIRYFSPIWRVLMLHIVKCKGVANISTVPEETLSISSKKVNVDNTADKSLSGTTVQPVGQPKASTDKRPKKKKNSSSSEPKTSKFVRESQPKKQVNETRHAEESVATADDTKSLEASGSEHKKIVKAALDDPLAIDSGIKSMGNVSFDELFKDQNENAEAEESPFDTAGQEIEEADSDLESMPDDEIVSVSRNDDDDNDDEDFEEPLVADEIAAAM